MGTKVTVTEIDSAVSSSGLAALNTNLETLADEFDKILYRDDSTRSWQDTQDANSNRLINLPAPVSGTEPLRLVDATVLVSNSDNVYSSIGLISAISDQIAGDTVYLSAEGREGWFKWSGDTLSDKVTIDTEQGMYIAPDSDATGASGAWVRVITQGQLTVSMFGAVSSSTIDQSAILQCAIVVAIDEDYPLLIDVADLDCGGNEIWINQTGTAEDATRGGSFTMKGMNRRDCEIKGIYLSVGRLHSWYVGSTVVDPGTPGAELIYTNGIGNTFHNVYMENIVFHGCVRLLNLETASTFFGVQVFAEDDAFYDNIPASWGYNMGEYAETFGGPAGTAVPYAEITHLVEVLQCNHPMFITCRVQNGSDVSNNLGNSLAGYLVSACSNATWIGGNNNKNRRFFDFDAHPIYGGSNVSNPRVMDVHCENVEEYGFYIGYSWGGVFEPDMSMSTNWDDTTYPAIYVANTSVPNTLHFGGGIASLTTKGVGIEVVGGLVTVSTFFSKIDLPIKIGALCDGFDVNGAYYRDAGEEEVRVDPAVIPLRNVQQLDRYSAVGNIKNLKKVEDDWSGFALDTNKWAVLKGSDGSCADFAPSGGLLVGTTGAGTTNIATNGVQITSPLIWTPSNGRMTSIARANASSLSVNLFTGFTDTVSLEMPATIGASDVFTDVAADCVGFLYDRRADSDFWWLLAIKAGVVQKTVTDIVLTTNPVGANILMVQVDAAGDANFFIDGVLKGTITDAVTPGTALCQSFVGQPTTSTSITITNYFMAAEQDRAY